MKIFVKLDIINYVENAGITEITLIYNKKIDIKEN